ncbi:MAG: hypothetical protein HZB33_16210 [Nitrospirae bacterium]|nr:hypothetical protein [Nitrospirota bacterium]
MSYQAINKYIASVAVVLLLIAVAGGLSYYGISKRVYLPVPVIESISEPFHAFYSWKDKGIRGRILLLFDRKLNIEVPADIINEINEKGVPPDSYLKPQNYIYMALRNSMFRRVYHIIPDGSWEEVSNTLRDNRLTRKTDGYFFITHIATPVHILRMKDIPHLKEKVVAIINTEKWNREELSGIGDLFRNHHLEYDLITVAGNPAGQGIMNFSSKGDDGQ